MIKLHDQLPQARLWELHPSIEDATIMQLSSFDVQQEGLEKIIVIFGVTNAFTQTCSTQHVTGYLTLFPHFQNLGVDEIWCVSVNDAYVMNAWKEQLLIDVQMRMLSDGNAEFTTALGLVRDLTDRGMGLRSQRYSMLVKNGEVVVLNIEPEGKYVVSDAQQLLIQAQGVLDND